MALIWFAIVIGLPDTCQSAIEKLFPANLPELQWAEFTAAGFPQPVAGVIYSADKPPCCGVPLGGVGTGCVDIDVRGIWGFNSIFNPLTPFPYVPHYKIPRRLPEAEPILGLSVGQRTWVMTTSEFINENEIPWCSEPYCPGVWVPETKIQKINSSLIRDVTPAQKIHYWGHYPVADIAFETDAPVQVAMRAWSPFLPGNTAASNTPAAVFEVHLRNTSNQTQEGALAFNFPGPTVDEARSREFVRQNIDENFRGILIDSTANVSYVIGVIGDENARFGAGLNVNPDAWSHIGQKLPAPSFQLRNGVKYYQEGSASAAVDFTLDSQQSKTIRFLLAWYAPVFQGATLNKDIANTERLEWKAPEWMGKTLSYTHMYAARYNSALDVAQRITADHSSLLRRVLSWQNVIYSDPSLPAWLQDSLINNLYLITECGKWVQAKPPLGDWAFPGGVFALNESPRGCPHMACIPCDWYGNLPVVYFFPELARTTLQAFKQYQHDDGEVPFALGNIGNTPDFATPEFFWQKSLNGMCYVDMVDRLRLRVGDQPVLQEFYESAKKVTSLTMNMSSKPAAPIRMPDDGGMEWFEHGEWAGMATHMGGLRLAMLRMMEQMALLAGDQAYVEKCRAWFAEGSKAMEEKMWAGNYYLNFWEPETNKKSDEVMGYQLDGEWAAAFHGLPGVFNPDRVKTTLQTIRKFNVALAPDVGAVNFTRSDGSPISKEKKDQAIDNPLSLSQEQDEKIVHYGTYAMFTAEVVVLGMTYMNAGQRAFGLDLVRKHWENLLCRQRHPWDGPNIVRGDTGQRVFGTDYYQVMMLWALPAAVADQDLRTFSAEGGLVDRIIEAASITDKHDAQN